MMVDDLNNMFEESGSSLDEFKQKVSDAADALEKLRKKSKEAADKELPNYLRSIGQALDDYTDSIDKNGQKWSLVGGKLDKLKAKQKALMDSMDSKSVSQLTKELFELESEITRTTGKISELDSEIKKAGEDMRKAASFEGEMTDATDVAGGSFQNLAKKIQEYRSGAAGTITTTALLTGGTIFLGKAAGDLANQFRDVVKDLNAYQVQLEATSKISLASPTGIQGLESLRATLGTTRTEFQSFLPVLQEASKIGIDTSSLQSAAQNIVALYGEGGQAQQALKEYADLLQKIPSLAQDLSFNARPDDRSVALFALAESGSVDVAIKAGLLGGMEAPSEAAEIQTDIQKSLRVQEDIKNEIKNLISVASSALPLLTEIGEYANIFGSVLKAGVIPAISMAGNTAFIQRSEMIALMAKQAAVSGNQPIKGTIGRGLDLVKRVRSEAAGARRGGAGLGGAISAGSKSLARGLGLAGKSAAIAGKSIAVLGTGAAVAAAAIAGWKIGTYIREQMEAMGTLTERMKESSVEFEAIGAVLYGGAPNIKEFNKAINSGSLIENRLSSFGKVLDITSGKTGTFSESLGKTFENIGYFNLAVMTADNPIGTLGLLFGKASKYHEEMQAAAAAAADKMQDVAASAGYLNFEEMSSDLMSLNESVKAAIQSRKKEQEAALKYQQAIQSIEAASKSAAVRLFEFGAEASKTNMELQKALGATTDSYYANARTVTQSLGQALAKRARDVGSAMEKAVQDLGSTNPDLLATAYQKAQKVMADETRKFVSEFESVIQQLARTPAIIEAELRGELSGAGLRITDTIGAGLDISSALGAFEVQMSAFSSQMRESSKMFGEFPNQMAAFAKGLNETNEANDKYAREAAERLSGWWSKELSLALSGGTREGETEEQAVARGRSTGEAIKTGTFEAIEDLNGVIDSLRAQQASLTEDFTAAKAARIGLAEAAEVMGSSMANMDLDFSAQIGDLRADEYVINLQLEKTRLEEQMGQLEGAAKTRAEERIEEIEETIADSSKARQARFKKLEGMGSQELEEKMAEVRSNIEAYQSATQKMMDALSGLASMDAGDLEKRFGINIEQAQALAAAIKANPNMGFAQVTEVAREILGEKAPEALRKMVDSFEIIEGDLRFDLGEVTMAIIAASNESNRQGATVRMQLKFLQEGVSAFMKGLTSAMNNFNKVVQAEGDRAKSAMLDVAIMEVFDSNVLGMPFDMFNDRYRANLEAIRATSENAAEVRANAIRSAEEIAASIDLMKGKMEGGQITREGARKEVEDAVKKGEVSKEMGQQMIEAINMMASDQLNADSIAAILKKTAIRATLEKEMQSWNRIIETSFRGFESIDISRSVGVAMNAIDEMVDVARFGFVDLAQQAAEANQLIAARSSAEQNYYESQIQRARELQKEVNKDYDERIARAREAGMGEEDIQNIERQREATLRRLFGEELAASKRAAMVMVKAEKERLKYIFAAIDLEQRRAEISEEIAQTQLSVLEQIGAPYASILEKQAEIVAQSKKQAEFETKKYQEMRARLGDTVETREQELKMVKATAKVAQQTIQAQRSAMEKLLGAAIGELGNIGGFKRNLLAQQRGTGLTIGPGGIVLGGAGTALSKSQQAAALQTGSMIRSGMGQQTTTKEPSKDLKEATDEATKTQAEGNRIRMRNNELLGTLNQRINGMLGNKAPAPTNVPIPRDRADDLGQSGFRKNTGQAGAGAGADVGAGRARDSEATATGGAGTRDAGVKSSTNATNNPIANEIRKLDEVIARVPKHFTELRGELQRTREKLVLTQSEYQEQEDRKKRSQEWRESAQTGVTKRQTWLEERKSERDATSEELKELKRKQRTYKRRFPRSNERNTPKLAEFRRQIEELEEKLKRQNLRVQRAESTVDLGRSGIRGANESEVDAQRMQELYVESARSKTQPATKKAEEAVKLFEEVTGRYGPVETMTSSAIKEAISDVFARSDSGEMSQNEAMDRASLLSSFQAKKPEEEKERERNAERMRRAHETAEEELKREKPKQILKQSKTMDFEGLRGADLSRRRTQWATEMGAFDSSKVVLSDEEIEQRAREIYARETGGVQSAPATLVERGTTPASSMGTTPFERMAATPEAEIAGVTMLENPLERDREIRKAREREASAAGQAPQGAGGATEGTEGAGETEGAGGAGATEDEKETKTLKDLWDELITIKNSTKKIEGFASTTATATNSMDTNGVKMNKST